jgi:molybdopterin synthase catalytic subunit
VAGGILYSVMKVRVLPFGVLKDWLGAGSVTVEVREGTTVAELLAKLGDEHGGRQLKGIAVSVNAEYALAGQVLLADDEVGLLPPVSGGSDEHCVGGGSRPATWLTREPIDGARLSEEAKHGEDGAVVVFDGIVRNNTRGRKTLYLDYEAYEEMAEKQMRELAVEAREKFGVRHVTIVHRLGRLMVGETSVLIVVASAHRGQAYEASRWLIDTLKKKVPIWKKETFVDGAVWTDGEPFPDGLAVKPGGSNGV